MAVYEYNSQNQELKRVAGGTLYADCPIGSYIPFGGTAIPTGWLLCNGQAVSRTDYADLFAVIGTAYGSGDGSTTFNIPDLREAVPKGAGLTSKSNNHLDADGLAVGEFLDDRIQDHSHKTGSGTSGAVITLQSLGASNIEDFGTSQKGMVSSSYRTGATTEVKSVGSNYIIKAKQIGVPADFASAIDDVIDEKFSYSTSEVNTGKKWIDGKPIYRKVIDLAEAITVSNDWTSISVSISGISKITYSFGLSIYLNGGFDYSFPIFVNISSSFSLQVLSPISVSLKTLILEYTKTTD